MDPGVGDVVQEAILTVSCYKDKEIAYFGLSWLFGKWGAPVI